MQLLPRRQNDDLATAQGWSRRRIVGGRSRTQSIRARRGGHCDGDVIRIGAECFQVESSLGFLGAYAAAVHKLKQ